MGWMLGPLRAWLTWVILQLGVRFLCMGCALGSDLFENGGSQPIQSYSDLEEIFRGRVRLSCMFYSSDMLHLAV